jgi:hypothetical protein
MTIGGVAARNDVDRLDQFLRRARLVQITRCAGTECANRVLVLRIHADHQDLELGVFLAQRLQDVDAVFPRQPDVHDQKLGIRVCAKLIAQLAVVARFGNDGHVGMLRQDLNDAATDDRMVVDDDGFDRHPPRS